MPGARTPSKSGTPADERDPDPAGRHHARSRRSPALPGRWRPGRAGPRLRPDAVDRRRLAAERIRQQQDPAHDQAAFTDPGRPVPPHGSGPASVEKPRTPFLSFLTTDAAGEPQRASIPIVDLKIEIAGRAIDLPPPPPSMRGPISVEGTLTTTFIDPIVHRMMLFNETEFEARLEHGRVVAIRELMWAAHNLFAHPISEITHWLGYLIPPLRRFGLWLHDITIPQHAEGTGRG
jgi:hypothetical protein